MIDWLKVQIGQGCPVHLRPDPFKPTRPGDRDLDRRLHVGRAHLRQHAAITKFNKAVHNGLGVRHRFNAICAQAKEPVRPRSLRAPYWTSVAESMEILRPMSPRWVCERRLGCCAVDVGTRHATKWTARCSQDDTIDLIHILSRGKTLKQSAMFAVNWEHLHAGCLHSWHDQGSRCDKRLLVCQGDVTAPSNAFEHGGKACCSDDRRHEQVPWLGHLRNKLPPRRQGRATHALLRSNSPPLVHRPGLQPKHRARLPVSRARCDSTPQRARRFRWIHRYSAGGRQPAGCSSRWTR